MIRERDQVLPPTETSLGLPLGTEAPAAVPSRSMTMYVAFLRGMNLGRRRVRNEELCERFEAMGFARVSAFLASGNVLFEAKAGGSTKLERAVEKGLEEHFGYEVPTFVRSASEVGAIAAHRPFSQTVVDRTGGKLQVAMLATRPGAPAHKAAVALSSEQDALAIHGRELYWLPFGNMSSSELDLRALSKTLGAMTIRTHRTMTRLVTKLAAAE